MTRIRYIIFSLLLGACDKVDNHTSKELIKHWQTDTAVARHGVHNTFIVIHNNTYRFNKGDTVGRVTFDDEGRVIKDDSNPYRTCTWTYDSLGMVKYLVDRDWDVSNHYKITHREVPDSSLVYQQFTDAYDSRYSYSEPFYFDKANRLIERISLTRENDLWNRLVQTNIRQSVGLFRDDTTEGKTIDRFFYDSLGRIAKIESWTARNLKAENQISYSTIRVTHWIRQ